MRLGITHARFASAEFARLSLIHSLRNTRGRGNRQITEALSAIIIIYNEYACLLLIVSTMATSLFTKQYSCRALLCLSRLALRDATFAGRAARRSVEAAAASHTVKSPFDFTHHVCTVFCIVLYYTCEWRSASQNL